MNTNHIGPDKSPAIGDTVIDVGFGGEVEYSIDIWQMGQGRNVSVDILQESFPQGMLPKVQQRQISSVGFRIDQVAAITSI